MSHVVDGQIWERIREEAAGDAQSEPALAIVQGLPRPAVVSRRSLLLGE
jgi:hypothetical protein